MINDHILMGEMRIAIRVLDKALSLACSALACHTFYGRDASLGEETQMHKENFINTAKKLENVLKD